MAWKGKATCNLLWGLYAFRGAGLELFRFGELGQEDPGDLDYQEKGTWEARAMGLGAEQSQWVGGMQIPEASLPALAQSWLCALGPGWAGT